MKIFEWIKDNIIKIASVPVVVSSGNFILLFIQSISDGVITNEELHSLIEIGSGIEIICLAAVMAVLKIRK